MEAGRTRGRGSPAPRSPSPPPPPAAAEQERLHLVRLTDSLSRGQWPTYARLACALNLLALRAMHAQLCRSLASLVRHRSYRARAPLSARVCGAVPFHPAGEGGQALGTDHPEVAYLREVGGGGSNRAGGGGGGGGSFASSSTFYSAFLHPLYVWAQCLDRQFYSQVRCSCCWWCVGSGTCSDSDVCLWEFLRCDVWFLCVGVVRVLGWTGRMYGKVERTTACPARALLCFARTCVLCLVEVARRVALAARVALSLGQYTAKEVSNLTHGLIPPPPLLHVPVPVPRPQR